MLLDDRFSINYISQDGEAILNIFRAYITDFSRISLSVRHREIVIKSWIGLDNLILIAMTILCSILLFKYAEVSLQAKILLSVFANSCAAIYLIYLTRSSAKLIAELIKSNTTSASQTI